MKRYMELDSTDHHAITCKEAASAAFFACGVPSGQSDDWGLTPFFMTSFCEATPWQG